MLERVSTEAGGAYRLGTPDPVLVIELGVTSWCNHRCAYCVTEVHAQRRAARHAFDQHPVEAWVAAFAAVPHDLALLCRGGEPFLDHEGFGAFLAGVGALPRLRYLRVDSNGSWSPERLAHVPREVRARTQLNLSFHPTQVTAELFERRVARIVEAGWQVSMINFVMEAGQSAGYAAVRERFQARHGIYVNANPDVFDAAPGPELARYLPALDLVRKTGAPTFGARCFFPAIAFFVGPDGRAARACGVREPGEPPSVDFLRDPAALRPLTAPVRCPQRACVCLDRYAFLEEHPRRGRSLSLLDEYVRDGRAHQEGAGC